MGLSKICSNLYLVPDTVRYNLKSVATLCPYVRLVCKFLTSFSTLYSFSIIMILQWLLKEYLDIALSKIYLVLHETVKYNLERVATRFVLIFKVGAIL